MDVSGIPNMGFGGSPAPFAPGGSFGSWSADDVNRSMGMGSGGLGQQGQAQLDNIFNNFGKQTDYYSNLGASYGRQTGGFGGYGGNNDPFSPVGGGASPAGQVQRGPDLPDLSYNPFGGSKGGVAPDSGNYQTHDAWQRDYDAYMGGGGPKYGFPFGGEPSASPGPAVPPASPFFGGSGSRDQLAQIFRDSMSPQGPAITPPDNRFYTGNWFGAAGGDGTGIGGSMAPGFGGFNNSAGGSKANDFFGGSYSPPSPFGDYNAAGG